MVGRSDGRTMVGWSDGRTVGWSDGRMIGRSMRYGVRGTMYKVWCRAPPSPPYNAAPPAPLGAGGGEIAKNRYRFGNGNPGTQPRRPYIIIYIANGNPRVPTLRIGENLGSRYAMAPNQKSFYTSGRLFVGSQKRFLTTLEPACESTLGALPRP